MSENTGNIVPLAWPRLVEEALRRRKAEGLTQRDHAALASVSIPTLAAFERGETTLTLAKAIDILRVVGLVDERTEGDTQEHFARAAFDRWRQLVSPLPEGAPGRFSNGWYRIDYWLEGDLRSVELLSFEKILREAVVRKSGWPPFWLPAGEAMRPREVDGLIECWMGDENPERAFYDPAHSDFWRAAPTGRMFLIRGYQEDGAETFPPGTILDTTLPLWRMGEVLLHAERLASLLAENESTPVMVHFRAMFTGLSGRVLRSWANPLSDLLIEGYPARGDEAVLEAKVPAGNIEQHLGDHLLPLLSSLYERFGVSGLGIGRVNAEVKRLLASNAGRR